MSKTSIIIHNYNRATVLQKCLASVEQQRFRPLEVVILDAGSNDKSHEVITGSSRRMLQTGIEVKSIQCPPLGVAASRNLGASEASGDYLCFLDNDARFDSSDSIGQMMELFRSNQNLGVISFRVLNGDTDEIDPFAWVFRRSPKDWATRPFKTFTFAGCGFCVKSDAFSDAGMFWDHLKYSREEEDLALALLDRGWELRYSPEIVVRHYFDPRGAVAAYRTPAGRVAERDYGSLAAVPVAYCDPRHYRAYWYDVLESRVSGKERLLPSFSARFPRRQRNSVKTG